MGGGKCKKRTDRRAIIRKCEGNIGWLSKRERGSVGHGYYLTRIERVEEEESQETRLGNKEKSKGDGGGRKGGNATRGKKQERNKGYGQPFEIYGHHEQEKGKRGS